MKARAELRNTPLVNLTASALSIVMFGSYYNLTSLSAHFAEILLPDICWKVTT